MTISDLAKTMLQGGQGAAFSLSPASGVLEPFGEQVIEIHGYSDMWGQYNDTLICKVSSGFVVLTLYMLNFSKGA